MGSGKKYRITFFNTTLKTMTLKSWFFVYFLKI
jgi:hypothetical protein